MTQWIDLPMPPPANNLFRTGDGGRRFKTSRYEAWLKEAVWLVCAGKGTRISGPYGLHLQAGRPDRRRRDLDNLLKPISDALVKGGAIRDDADCECIDARWVPGLAGVRVLVLPTKALSLGEAPTADHRDTWQHIGDVAARVIEGIGRKP